MMVHNHGRYISLGFCLRFRRLIGSADRPEADKPNPLGIPLNEVYDVVSLGFSHIYIYIAIGIHRNPYLAIYIYIAIGIHRNDWLSHFEGHRILQRSWRILSPRMWLVPFVRTTASGIQVPLKRSMMTAPLAWKDRSRCFPLVISDQF